MEKIFFKNSLGQRLCGILERPAVKHEHVIILIHGYSTSKDWPSIMSLSRELIGRQIDSLRIDLDGCGESDGELGKQTITSTVDDTLQAIEEMKKRGYKRIDLFGASAGGLTAMSTALQTKDIGRLGLRAPVSDYPSQKRSKHGDEYMALWKRNGHATYVNSHGLKLVIDYGFREDAKKHVMYGKARNITCPTLIIHGTADKSVDINYSRRLMEDFPSAKLIELKGADHGLYIGGDNSRSNRMFADWFEKGLVEEV
jgi:uncharacterized protein